MADPRDLVTIEQVKAYLNPAGPANYNTNSQSTVIPGMITAVSTDWLGLTGRRSLNRFIPVVDVLDGTGTERIYLTEFPVALVGMVNVCGVSVAQGGYSTNGTMNPGWVLDENRESLSIVGVNDWGGYGISRGAGGAYAAVGGPLARTYGGARFGYRDGKNYQNVQVQYFGGGAIMFAETVQVPASPYQIPVSQGVNFYSDLAQVYYTLPQNGQLVPLTGLASNPAQGEYAVASDGTYTFNAADEGAFVSITYAYNAAMPDVQQQVLEDIALSLTIEVNPGLKSRGTPETGTTSFMWNVAHSEKSYAVINRYKRAMTRSS